MMEMRGSAFLAVLLVSAFAASPVPAQPPVAPQEPGEVSVTFELAVAGPDGGRTPLPIDARRGYAAVPAPALAELGWTVERVGQDWRLRLAGMEPVRLQVDSPFFHWGDELLHLAFEPYLAQDVLYVPAQLLTDFLPERTPSAYRFVEGERVLRIPQQTPAPSPSPDETRVVVIDAGHGGRDLGAVGPSGTREKDVALGIARVLRDELARFPGLEVHMTRDSDELVPLWERGERATTWKGDRPGLFISIHANALPRQRSTRGFETYFLSDARTEHERRVAANENAPLAIESGGGEADGGRGELGFILKELRNMDHQHWSMLFAELVQTHVAPVHPGPDRGVKQGPFAVITNALMPAVLVEAGFISHPDEERVLGGAGFQRDVGRALAGAVLDFFERYPPGRGTELVEAGRERP